jgi:hypothetical protein
VPHRRRLRLAALRLRRAATPGDGNDRGGGPRRGHLPPGARGPRAYRLQDLGYDTVEANEKLGFPEDLRDYGIGAQILVDLGIYRMRLLTNNPQKLVGLEGYGLEVVERLPLVVPPNPSNARYLATKQEKMGHLLGLGEELNGH